MKKYVEITETLTEGSTEVPDMIRLTVIDELDAEIKYTQYAHLIVGHKAKFVEEKHADDVKNNKPCVTKKIINGKVEK